MSYLCVCVLVVHCFPLPSGNVCTRLLPCDPGLLATHMGIAAAVTPRCNVEIVGLGNYNGVLIMNTSTSSNFRFKHFEVTEESGLTANKLCVKMIRLI